MVDGVDNLVGTEVEAVDLRAGAAMVLAGLAAQGETYINNVTFIDRGYEQLVNKLNAMGAWIERIDSDTPSQIMQEKVI